MKLIPMTDFVLKKTNQSLTDEELINAFVSIRTYAKFLKLDLKIDMFLNESGRSNVFKRFTVSHINQGGFDRTINVDNCVYIAWRDSKTGLWRFSKGLAKVEDITGIGLKVNKEELKKLGL